MISVAFAIALGALLAGCVLFVIVVAVSCFDHVAGRSVYQTRDVVDGVLYLVSVLLVGMGLVHLYAPLCVAGTFLALVAIL